MTLVDTGPLVALCDGRDGQHRLAVTQLAQVATRGLCVCEAVLVETCFHLPHTVQRLRLQRLLGDLKIGSLSTEDLDFQDDVFSWLIKYADHQPDWADACLAVLSGRELGLRVWTYDREFRTTWRRPDGRSIPMAVR
jgi:predicted nucleic acid-binding protein